MKTAFWAAAMAASVILAAAAGCGPVRLDCFAVGAACGGDGDCCSFGCIEGTCRANPIEGGLCRTSGDCIGSLVCVDGKCQSGDRPDGDVCTSNYDCASTRCVDGVCTKRTDCVSLGNNCGSSTDCCSGLQCVGGKCSDVACKQEGSSCTESAQCCMFLGCANGSTCTSVCRSSSESCTQDNDCCSGYTCMGGSCRSSPGYEGQPCDNHAECEAGLRCAVDNICRPGQLGESCTSTPECDTWPALICTDGRCSYETPQSVGTHCVAPADCSSGSCDGTTSLCCRPTNASCDSFNGDDGCCTGTVCLNGTNQCGACLNAGQNTNSINDCCTGLDYESGKCCAKDGSQGSASECCSGLSPAGTCCQGLNYYSTDPNTVCCPGLVYDSSRYACVKPAGSTCTAWSECEGGNAAACQNGLCCIEPAGKCDANSDCCSGTCSNGVCAPMPLNGTCDADNQCDPATTAACNTFTYKCCAGAGDACGAAGDCCPYSEVFMTLTCGTAGACCRPAGATCDASTASQCCSGICKANNTCQ